MALHKTLFSFSPLVFERCDSWQLCSETLGNLRSDLRGMKRRFHAVTAVTIGLSCGRLLLWLIPPEWTIRRARYCIASSSFFSHAPPHHHQHLPHAVGGSPLLPHATVESDCHTDLRYLQGPSVIAGQPGFHTLSREHQAWAAPPAGWLDDFSLCSQLRNCPEIGFVSRRAAGLSRYQL